MFIKETTKKQPWLKQNRPILIVLTLATIYTLFFTYYAIQRHHCYQTHAYDLGIFTQSFNSLTQGRFLYTNLWEGPRYARHLSPILLIIYPIFRIIPQAETLLILQTIILAAGAIPVYLIARHELNEKAGVIFSFAYLVYPALHGMNLFDFHELSLAPPFILASYYYYETNRVRTATLYTTISLLIREDVPLAVVPLLMYQLWKRRKKWRTPSQDMIDLAFTLLAGSLWFILSLGAIIPLFNNSQNYFYASLYGLPYLFTDLDLKASYIINLIYPLLFTPLLSPFVLLAFPVLSQSLFTYKTSRYEISNHHPSLLIPFIFISAIKGIKDLSTVIYVQPRLVQKLTTLTVTGIIFTSLLTSPLSYDQFPQPTQHHKTISTIIDTIPSESSVLTQNDLFPHLVNGYDVYYSGSQPFQGWRTPLGQIIPWKHQEDGFKSFDYVLIDTRSNWNLLERMNEQNLAYLKTEYNLKTRLDGILLYQHDYKGNPNSINSHINGFTDGLIIEYYNNTDLQGPTIYIDRVPNICYDWNKDSPIIGIIPENQFSARFTGIIIIPTAGTYQIKAEYDNGARVWINNEQIMDAWDGPGAETAIIDLKKGEYPFKLEYWERVSNAHLELKWITPSTSRYQPIPPENFKPQ